MGTHANRGRALEEAVEWMNSIYLARGIARIHKVPTEWIPIRNRRGKIVSAKVERVAAVDFLGAWRGVPIAFDVKETRKSHIRWDRLQPHQRAFLQDWQEIGKGYSFVLVAFESYRPEPQLFLVPWEYWREGYAAWRRGEGRASFGPDSLPPELSVSGFDYGLVLDILLARGHGDASRCNGEAV